MTHRQGPRLPQRVDAQRYVQRIELLERQVAELPDKIERVALVQLRVSIHELIREMENLQQLRDGRFFLLGRARAMLREVVERDPRRAGGGTTTRRDPWSLKRRALEALKRDLRSVEVSKFLSERDQRLRSGRDIGSETTTRQDVLDARLRSLADAVRRQVSHKRDRDVILARIQRNRVSLERRPKQKEPRQLRLVQKPSTVKSQRARLREAIEMDERERREQRSSIRTVSGGLPGLGNRS